MVAAAGLFHHPTMITMNKTVIQYRNKTISHYHDHTHDHVHLHGPGEEFVCTRICRRFLKFAYVVVRV